MVTLSGFEPEIFRMRT